MIRVNFTKDSSGNYVGVLVEGHSGYAERGRDIVCAGVSTIVQATLLYLDQLGSTYSAKVEDGYTRIRLAGIGKNTVPMEVLEAVLLAIELEHPAHLVIKEDTIW